MAHANPEDGTPATNNLASDPANTGIDRRRFLQTSALMASAASALPALAQAPGGTSRA